MAWKQRGQAYGKGEPPLERERERDLTFRRVRERRLFTCASASVVEWTQRGFREEEEEEEEEEEGLLTNNE